LSCNTLVKLTDLYKYLSFQSDEARDAAKQLEQSTYSPQLRVVIQYPLDGTGYEEFFNPKGELSGIVLLDKTQDVCLAEDDKKGLKIPSVKLEKIMMAGAKWEGQYGA
jgi:hypothetical protein